MVLRDLAGLCFSTMDTYPVNMKYCASGGMEGKRDGEMRCEAGSKLAGFVESPPGRAIDY